MKSLQPIIEDAIKSLPRGARTSLQSLLEPHCLEIFAKRLAYLHESGGEETLPAPTFSSEVTRSSRDAYSHFASAMTLWQSAPTGEVTSEQQLAITSAFVNGFRSASLDRILRILGQRLTTSSISDVRAFPPPRNRLVASASAPVREDVVLSCSARALDKHSYRHDSGGFWSLASGSDEEKNEHALRCVQRILDEATWWNVFLHGNFGPIYEARVESGHGARWTIDGSQFIGFVEPHDPKEASARSGNQEDAAQVDFEDKNAQATASSGDDATSPNPNDPESRSADQIDSSSLTKLTRQHLLAEMQEGRKDFRYSDLSGENLSGLDLSGLDFTGSDFRKAKLFKTTLARCKMNETNLGGVFLSGTDISGATLRRANMMRCRADNALWRDVDLESARLDDANLRKIQIENGRMRRVGLKGADLSDARFIASRLYGAFLEQANFTGAYFFLVRFANARMSQVLASEAMFDRCSFDNASLQQADCTSTVFRECKLSECQMPGIDLTKAHFENAKLNHANLTQARLNEASLRSASLIRADISKAKLRDCDLTAARLDQADLSRCDLRGASLDDANLQGANLTGADVVDTQVNENSIFEAAKTVEVDFGTNWLLRQRVLESAHNLTIRHFRRKHPVIGFLWWAMLGCGRKPVRLLHWGIVIVVLFAAIMATWPSSFDFGHDDSSFIDHLRNSLAVFVTLDLAVDKGTDTFGRSVMLVEMLLSYLMLGFMASLFSSIFPNSPE